MMFENLLKGLSKLPAKSPTLEKDAIARLLHTNPKALEAFEASYAKYALEQETSDNFFQINSRQASAHKHAEEIVEQAADLDASARLQSRIVSELMSQTSVYVFDGVLAHVERPLALPPGTKLVQNEEIKRLPESLRPQLTGELMKVDIAGSSHPAILYFYNMYLNGKTQKERDFGYHHFRQGLDILDLDAVTYEIIGMNRNSMGHWLPQLVEACRGQSFFRIPATTIARVPMTLLQLAHLEYAELTQATLNIVDQWAYEAFRLRDDKDYFIKTGTYSSKYDFRNALVHGAKEVRELGEYLVYIHSQALHMAGALCKPCIYGVSTTNEWVVREFVPDKEGNPCIYNGMPLHTEYRVFVDCDSNEIIGITPYWEPKTMEQRFGHDEDADSPHQLHDYVIYKAHEDTLMRRYYENKDAVAAHLKAILPELRLSGQWSIDVMQNGDDFWIIDMGVAEESFFYKTCVPPELRNPSNEDWMPRLPA